MKVYLNGLELDGEGPASATVGQALDELREEISNAGKLITAIAVDGELLQGESERERVHARLQTEVERIELTVEEPKALLTSGLVSTRDFLQSLRRDFTKTATAFRLGHEVAANDDLAHCLDDLKLVITGMNAASRLPGVKEETESLRQAITASHTRLLPVLDTMYKAQAAGDYVTLADGLEYDLTEIADEWLSGLNHALHGLTVEERAVAAET
ncbi:MAG: hypothetical protein V1784_01850 [bacterium]